MSGQNDHSEPTNRSPKHRSLRNLILRLAILALVLSVLFVKLIGPPAPSAITIYTGMEGTSFYEDGPRYAEVLARHGIDARLVATGGSIENLDSLVHGEGPRVGFAEAALIRTYQTAFADSVAAARAGEEEPGPAGVAGDFGEDEVTPDSALSDLQSVGAAEEVDEEEADLGLESLGALYLEPFWVFVPARRDLRTEADLEGLLVFPGREGTGTRVLAEALLRVNGIEDVQIYEPGDGIGEEEIAEALLRGEVQAVFAMGDPMSPAIQQLLLDRRIRPFSFRRAEAYDRKFEFISALTLPEGTIDLRENVPSEELQLLASSIQLVTPADLNPVLVDALLDAATEIHQRPTLFSTRGSYPNGNSASLPLDPTAERFYSEGFAKWRSYVPFWLATWVDRFALAFGALAAAGVFLSVVPRLLAWPFSLLLSRMTSRIVRVEQGLTVPEPRDALMAEIDAVDAESAHLWVPPTERVTYMEFRQLIADVRDRVESLPGATDPS
jgi:TRAP-type uncharacterized transport system substrate-binding protein